jgi:SNF2 family DNA or RNA helicase
MRTKEQCLDLPEKITKTVYIELTEKQKTLYREVQKDVRDRKEEILASPTPMGRFVALRKVTGCPRDLMPDFQIEDCSKVLVMLELIEQAFANGEKVIVFTWHIPTLMFINEVLYLRGITPAIMYGDISQEDRDRNKEAFQNNPDCKIIIGNYQTMGTGHDLYAGSCVIEYEQPWTAADENQAQDRAHRIGVTKTVTCIRLVSRNTVDERVCDIVDSKRDLSDAVENKKFIADMVEKTLNMQI